MTVTGSLTRQGDFPNKGRDLYDMTEAMHTWEPLKKEDGLKRNKKGTASLKKEK